MKKKIAGGFSLIELMVVLVIIGILASIAYSSYLDSIRSGRRAEGRTALADLMQQQERYMTQNNTYFAFTTNSSGVTSPADTPFKTHSGENPATASYFLSAFACDDSDIRECVRVDAVPVPGKPDPEAGTLQILSSGSKTCTGTIHSKCWK